MTYQFPSIIDSTILTTFRACPKKAQYSFFHNLGGGKSIDLHFGGAFAAGMEAARKAHFISGLSPEQSVAAGMNKALEFYGDFDSERHDTKPKNVGTLLSAMEGYFQEWPLGSDGLVPLNGRDGIEFTFAIPVPGFQHPDTDEPLLYGGRFDLLGEYLQLSSIVDEKTTSSFSSNWISQWSLRNQFLGYVWAARHYGVHVTQVIVRGVAIQVKEIKFLQALIIIPDFMLERWYIQLQHDLERFIAAYRAGYFDFNFADSCTSFGGCQFQELCKAKEPSEWFGNFSQRNWSPLKKDPEA